MYQIIYIYYRTHTHTHKIQRPTHSTRFSCFDASVPEKIKNKPEARRDRHGRFKGRKVGPRMMGCRPKTISRREMKAASCLDVFPLMMETKARQRPPIGEV